MNIIAIKAPDIKAQVEFLAIALIKLLEDYRELEDQFRRRERLRALARILLPLALILEAIMICIIFWKGY